MLVLFCHNNLVFQEHTINLKHYYYHYHELLTATAFQALFLFKVITREQVINQQLKDGAATQSTRRTVLSKLLLKSN